MKALTIRQPWAWLIVHGPKRIENRSWFTRFRGEFLVHAAKGMTRTEYESAVRFAYDSAGFVGDFPRFGELERGGITGAANLAGCTEQPHSWLESLGWAIEGQYGFRLDDVRRLQFVPCVGALGFWDVPPGVLEQLRSAA